MKWEDWKEKAAAHQEVVMLRLHEGQADEHGLRDGFVRFAEHPLLEQQSRRLQACHEASHPQYQTPACASLESVIQYGGNLSGMLGLLHALLSITSDKSIAL